MADGLLLNINDRTRRGAQQDLLKPNHDELVKLLHGDQRRLLACLPGDARL